MGEGKLSDTPLGDLARKGSFIMIFAAPRAPKTARFFVLSEKGEGLGKIAWYGPWRRYTFSADDTTLFEPTCLREIAQFLDDLMAERRKK